jgi:hypothetical protein
VSRRLLALVGAALALSVAPAAAAERHVCLRAKADGAGFARVHVPVPYERVTIWHRRRQLDRDEDGFDRTGGWLISALGAGRRVYLTAYRIDGRGGRFCIEVRW